ncbi:MAG: DegT/DnrJ/EryC1/StrS family aminotransferase [Candidatus Theseobacter exili]|nr:DegT/DnrJ/EryC1/StrS family aminotransferase [Candidatus Theseobacter exili]
MKLNRKIPLTKPYITDEIKRKLLGVLDSGFLTEGKVTNEFEESVKRYTECGHAIAVTSCTTGLEIALRALTIGKGDEVIVPDYTYPATADVVRIVGAKVIIVDIDRNTLNIDYAKIKKAITTKTRAIIPVSLFGNPLNWDELDKIRNEYGVNIIEDAACSLGSEYDGKKTGNLADISVFSFHPRKFITTGEGGMITTNDPEWADRMRSYKHFGAAVKNGKISSLFEHIGTNYKMSDILASLGVVYMQCIDELLIKRQEQAEYYLNLLSGKQYIGFQKMYAKAKHSWQSFCVFVDERDTVMQKMREHGVEAQIGTHSLHKCKAFAESNNCKIKGNMKNSTYAYKHCLTLPLYHEMSKEEQRLVVDILINNICSKTGLD